MSHSVGEIIRHGAIIGYFEFNGTVDVVIPTIRASEDEVCAHWREEKERPCSCDAPPDEVLLYAEGRHWPAQVCLACAAIVGELGVPEKFTGTSWHENEYPKNGHPLRQETTET